MILCHALCGVTAFLCIPLAMHALPQQYMAWGVPMPRWEH